MKKLFTLLAFIGIMGAANAQSSTTDAPKKEDAAKVEKTHGCAGHDHSKAAASHADAKAPSCCAGKAKAGKACCHGDAKADAGEGHGHSHDVKAHVCTEACKEDAHLYACGEEGHTCSVDCHAKM